MLHCRIGKAICVLMLYVYVFIQRASDTFYHRGISTPDSLSLKKHFVKLRFTENITQTMLSGATSKTTGSSTVAAAETPINKGKHEIDIMFGVRF